LKEQVLESKPCRRTTHRWRFGSSAFRATRTGRIWTYVGDDEHPYTV